MDQIQREKVLDKLGKLKALAERGVGGERETALRKYEELCQKYGISDLEAENALKKVERRWFGYKTDLEEELLTQIFYKVTGSDIFYVYRGDYKRRKKRGIECTPIEAAEIDLLFNFYKKQMEEELRVFMIAFKQKNDLFPDEKARCYEEPQESDRELTEEELRRYKKAAFMRDFMDKKQPPRAAIEEKRREKLKAQVSRDGSAALLEYLETAGFFTAPAGMKHHGAFPGGLVAHSNNVYRRLVALNTEEIKKAGPIQRAAYSYETLAVVALLHDVCKVDVYHLEEKDGQQSYSYNDPLPLGHGEKSVYMITQFMQLTPEEALAIRWHMGAYDKATQADLRDLDKAQKRCKLATMLHLADMMATHFDEAEG